MRAKALGLLVGLLLVLSVGLAQADLTPFHVSGQFDIPDGATIDGTFKLDVLTGFVSDEPDDIDIDVTLPGSPPTIIEFYTFSPGSEIGGVTTLNFLNGGSSTALVLSLSFNGSLTGFMGGTIFQGFVAPLGGGTPLAAGLTGTVSAAVPEPATLALLGIGIAGLAFARRRKLT